MLGLYLLALVGLVHLTDPTAFSSLCSPTGECPAGWFPRGRDCLKKESKDECEKEGMDSTEHVMIDNKTEPYCLVTWETQCQCGRYRQHYKLKHPMTKEEEVLEEQDHMDPQDFDPRTFLAMLKKELDKGRKREYTWQGKSNTSGDYLTLLSLNVQWS